MRKAAALVALVVSLAGGARAQAERTACDAAAANAERTWDVPPGVLSAVGTVESGRRSGDLGPAPWPWTINAAGHGIWFATKAEAIAGVLAVMERGYPYIDVGCFQIDIAYHTGVFRSLDDAFDPERNAQAAAQILVAERARVGSWDLAVAHYHSATPGLGLPYLDRVRAALPAARLRGSMAAVAALPLGQAQTLPRVLYPPTVAANAPQVIHLGPATVPIAAAPPPNDVRPPVSTANSAVADASLIAENMESPQ